MPKVSVILTCYNHIRYLPEALESIRSQTHQDLEIIAIDDGSKDGTREWLTENASDCKLIFNESNLGTYGSLNRAIEEATGDFIAILNDDDVWLPNKLSLQLALLGENPEMGLCHTGGKFIDGSGQVVPGSPLGFTFPRTRNGRISLDLAYQNKIIASAALFRREVLDTVGKFNPAYFGSGDWEMWMRISLAYTIGFVDEELTFYRVHGENASHKLDRIWQDDERLREWIRTLEPRWREGGYLDVEIKRAIAHNEACLGTIYTLNGKRSMGRKAYGASIRRQPMRLKSVVRWLFTFLPASWFRRSIRL